VEIHEDSGIGTLDLAGFPGVPFNRLEDFAWPATRLVGDGLITLRVVSTTEPSGH
jgi:hypothetical protein